jgi:hypothetical protein
MIGLQQAQWKDNNNNDNNNNEIVWNNPFESNPPSKQSKLSDFNVS